MSATPRITVAALAQQVADTNARTEHALDGIMSVLGGLVELVQGGQFNTPAPVVSQITEAPSMRGLSAQIAAATGKGKAAKKATPAKVAMPTALKEGFAMVRDTKDAISPLNKALAATRKGQPWKKATECTPDEVAAALAHIVQENPKRGKAIANAALSALVLRVEAAEKRAAGK